MLAHRLRRWPNITPALGQRLVLAGYIDDLDAHMVAGNWVLTLMSNFDVLEGGGGPGQIRRGTTCVAASWRSRRSQPG